MPQRRRSASRRCARHVATGFEPSSPAAFAAIARLTFERCPQSPGLDRRQAEAADQIRERSRRQLAQVCDGVDASALGPLQHEFEALVVHVRIEVQRAEERRQLGLADLFGMR